MSQETMDWLNKNTLIGFTEERGNAWHWRQGTDNHFSGEVPVEEVYKRLFHWEPVKITPKYDWENPNAVPVAGCFDCITAEGVCAPHATVERTADDMSFIVRSDTGALLGSHSSGFAIHGYREWLLQNTSTIMSGNLQIGQAGLLRGGAQAWVSFEIPETISFKGKIGPAVEFRPQLLATTSLDGSIATTYKPVLTVVVCDNTRNIALREKTYTAFKVKHTKNSSLKIGSAREALGIVHEMAETFTAELDTLLKTRVSSQQWDAFKELYVPRPEEKGRGQTIADNKRDVLNELYEKDPRCEPWRGTAYGVVQAVNTYMNHGGTVKKVGRAERLMENVVRNKLDDFDMNTFDFLNKALVGAK